jgi:MYXO-CTERM domain-containing protein
MSTPRNLMDGKAHAVYAYGINHTAGGVNTLLTDSPKSFTCAAPAIAAGTVKRHVTSTTILADWRFDTFRDMAPYSTAVLAAVPDGVDLGSAPDIVQAPGDPAVYVADQTFKRHIVSPESLAAWRLTGADVKAITAAELAALIAGPDWPNAPLLAKDPANPAVYLLDSPLPAAPGPDAGSVSEEADAGGSASELADAGSFSGQVDGGSALRIDAGSSQIAPPTGSVGSTQGCSVAGASHSGGANWLAVAGMALLFALRSRRR